MSVSALCSRRNMLASDWALVRTQWYVRRLERRSANGSLLGRRRELRRRVCADAGPGGAGWQRRRLDAAIEPQGALTIASRSRDPALWSQQGMHAADACVMIHLQRTHP